MPSEESAALLEFTAWEERSLAWWLLLPSFCAYSNLRMSEFLVLCACLLVCSPFRSPWYLHNSTLMLSINFELSQGVCFSLSVLHEGAANVEIFFSVGSFQDVSVPSDSLFRKNLKKTNRQHIQWTTAQTTFPVTSRAPSATYFFVPILVSCLCYHYVWCVLFLDPSSLLVVIMMVVV